MRGQTRIPIVDAGLRQLAAEGSAAASRNSAGLDPADIQTPWKLAPIPGYPGPIVELS